MRVGALCIDQVNPPTADQLLLPSNHAMCALFLYHHWTGHEHLMATEDFVNLRQYVHDWMDNRVDTDWTEVRAELQAIIDQEDEKKAQEYGTKMLHFDTLHFGSRPFNKLL